MAKLSVEIVTPEKRILSSEADEVVMPGAEGLFGVRPGHTAYLSVMGPGPLAVREEGREETYFVTGGFAEVNADKVMVLANHAEPVDRIDVPAAEQRLAEAQARLAGLPATDPRYAAESTTVQHESARIAAASRR